MNLILIGYRGTGKSTVAKILSERFQARLISTDEVIITKTGMSVPEIVESKGWDYFRELESGVIKEISNEDDCIIDAGGGVVLKNENIKNLKKNSKIVLLKTEPKIIAERIKDDTQRPSLTEEKSFIDEINEVLKERKPLYEKAADFSVDTSNLTPEEVALKIIGYLRK